MLPRPTLALIEGFWSNAPTGMFSSSVVPEDVAEHHREDLAAERSNCARKRALRSRWMVLEGPFSRCPHAA